MIYVIVRESGSYSDYGMEILCAYTHQPTAEAKLAELEGIQKRAKDAYEEFRALESQLCERHQPPTGQPDRTGVCYWETPEWMAYGERYDEYQRNLCSLLAQAAEQVAAKHDIPVDAARYGDNDATLSIVEVEGY